MDNSLEKPKGFALDLLFPKFCLGCQKEGTYLCDDCRGLLDISEYNYCLCDKPIRIANSQKSGSPLTNFGIEERRNTYNQLNPKLVRGKCPRCQNKSLSGLYFALPYKEKQLTKKLIYQFKYPPYLKDLAETLSSLLIEHFVLSGKNTDDIWENSILIPVPSDAKKIRERGYNQCEELAKELSKILNIPVASDILIKTKFTAPQMELSKEGREKNLENAFSIKNSGTQGTALRDKKIFLVDDVYTTGSTMNECAKVLKNSGAKIVWGIALAREE